MDSMVPDQEKIAGYRPAAVDRVRSGEVLTGTFALLGSPLTVEICGSAGFDWVLIDLEHGAGDDYVLLSQLQALAATPAAGLARVASNSRVDITKALDRGAVGVMVPRIETAADAQAAVRHVRYPPHGDRGVALMNRGAGFGSISAQDLQAVEPLLIVQIETPPALSNLSAIAGTAGVDVLFVGPSDLTWSLGAPGQFEDPAYRAAIRDVAETAAQHSKAAGILLSDLDAVPYHLDLGYTFIGISGDAGLLRVAARTAATKLKDLVPSNAAHS